MDLLKSAKGETQVEIDQDELDRFSNEVCPTAGQEYITTYAPLLTNPDQFFKAELPGEGVIIEPKTSHILPFVNAEYCDPEVGIGGYHTFHVAQKRPRMTDNKLLPDVRNILPNHYKQFATKCSDCGLLKYCLFEEEDFIEERGWEGRKRECRHWGDREEVSLVGLYCHINECRLSFKPTEGKIREAKAQGRDPSKLIWQELQEMFETASRRYYVLTGEKTPRRTVHALERHLKELKKRPRSEANNTAEPFFRKYRNQFEQQYNANYILTCSEKEFESFKEEILYQNTCHENCSRKRKRL